MTLGSGRKPKDRKTVTQLPELLNVGEPDSGLKTSRNVRYVDNFNSLAVSNTEMRKTTQNNANVQKEIKTELPKIDLRKMSVRVKDPESIVKLQQKVEGKAEKLVYESITERSENSYK